MNTTILEPKVEILDKLPESFSEAEKVNIVQQLQGMVAAGYSQDGLEGFEELNFPNIERFMGGKYDSTGGQSLHTGEKTYFEAKHGQPTIMFAMQTRKNASNDVILARHNNPNELDGSDAVVAYLPFNIFAEAGIDAGLIDENGLLPKEIAMAHRKTLFPAIANAINEFLSENIENFEQKHVIIDGNYADGMQTVLDLQKKLHDENHQGKIVTIGTFHTHGINKFVDNAVKELGGEHDFVTYLRGLQQDGVYLRDIPVIEAKIKQYDLQALNDKYAFTDRLTIEAIDNIAKPQNNDKIGFDAVVAVDDTMHDKLAHWMEDAKSPTEVGFAKNGYNSNVYNIDVLSDKTPAEINDLVRPLLEQAYRLNPDFPIEISDRQLEGTNFITACRPESRKNSDGAINAFVEWALQNPHDMGGLILIGHAPENVNISDDQQKIIAQIKEYDKLYPNLNIENRVLLLPSMRSDAISTIMSLERAVGLAASKQEPWGIGAVEMMAKGIPLIASDLYASATHVKTHFAKAEDKNSIILFYSPSNAGVTPESSKQSFVDAMNEVSGDNYNKYKANAQNLADVIPAEFSWKAMFDTYEKLANKILNKKLDKNLQPDNSYITDVTSVAKINEHNNFRSHSK
jgi:glycosyltransferase involved in cell wall biosynthesis